MTDSETKMEYVREHLPKIDSAANKYTRGRLFVVCGSPGMAGACVMAVRAALRSGAGYADVAVPEEIYPIVSAAVPEAVFTVLKTSEYESASLENKLAERLEKADACLVGCGLGDNRKIFCPTVFKLCRKPLLIDADGLNYLSENPKVKIASGDVVMTPHAGELSRLMQKSAAELEADREEAAARAARHFGATLLFKGPGTVIAEGTRLLVNPTGNAGMARAGSGDVLSGIIASLMAQGMSGFEAAAAGAYIHGTAGDMCAQRLSIRSMLPEDMIDVLPEVFRLFER